VANERAPVFIVGFARSGTTLLAAMLDRHSAIAVTPETHFCDHFYAVNRTAPNDQRAFVDAMFTHPRILDLGVGVDAVLAEFAPRPTDHANLFAATLEAYRKQRGKAYVIEKTPAHLPYVPILARWFPAARFIYIERDGRDAVMSLMRMPWSHKNLRRHARMWRWCVKRAERFQRDYGPRWLHVQYEALARNPERELTRVCGFLGVEFEASQLDRSIPTAVVPAWEHAWKQNAAHDAVNAGRIHDWRSAASRKQQLVMNSMMCPALRARGYPDVNASASISNAALNALYLFAYHPRVRPALAAIRNAAQPLLGDRGQDRPEADGVAACEAWHREHRTRERMDHG
jgi:hypothetical protein